MRPHARQPSQREPCPQTLGGDTWGSSPVRRPLRLGTAPVSATAARVQDPTKSFRRKRFLLLRGTAGQAGAPPLALTSKPQRKTARKAREASSCGKRPPGPNPPQGSLRQTGNTSTGRCTPEKRAACTPREGSPRQADPDRAAVREGWKRPHAGPGTSRRTPLPKDRGPTVSLTEGAQMKETVSAAPEKTTNPGVSGTTCPAPKI